MSEPIRTRLVEVNFMPEDRSGILVTLEVGYVGQTFRSGNYLLIEADEEYHPVESD